MYNNKNRKILKFSDFEKNCFFLKKYLFLDGQEKSNFQNFSNEFCISLEDVKNCLNINFYEKNLKIGFFLAKKRCAKKFFFHVSK